MSALAERQSKASGNVDDKCNRRYHDQKEALMEINLEEMLSKYCMSEIEIPNVTQMRNSLQPRERELSGIPPTGLTSDDFHNLYKQLEVLAPHTFSSMSTRKAWQLLARYFGAQVGGILGQEIAEGRAPLIKGLPTKSTTIGTADIWVANRWDAPFSSVISAILNREDILYKLPRSPRVFYFADFVSSSVLGQFDDHRCTERVRSMQSVKEIIVAIPPRGLGLNSLCMLFDISTAIRLAKLIRLIFVEAVQTDLIQDPSILVPIVMINMSTAMCDDSKYQQSLITNICNGANCVGSTVTPTRASQTISQYVTALVLDCSFKQSCLVSNEEGIRFLSKSCRILLKLGSCSSAATCARVALHIASAGQPYSVDTGRAWLRLAIVFAHQRNGIADAVLCSRCAVAVLKFAYSEAQSMDVDLQSSLLEAYMLLGNLNLKENRPLRARAAFQKAIATADSVASHVCESGCIPATDLHIIQKFRSAAHAALGSVFWWEGNVRKALEMNWSAIRERAEHGPYEHVDNVRILCNFADCCLEIKDNVTAKRAFHEAHMLCLKLTGNVAPHVRRLEARFHHLKVDIPDVTSPVIAPLLVAFSVTIRRENVNQQWGLSLDFSSHKCLIVGVALNSCGVLLDHTIHTGAQILRLNGQDPVVCPKKKLLALIHNSIQLCLVVRPAKFTYALQPIKPVHQSTGGCDRNSDSAESTKVDLDVPSNSNIMSSSEFAPAAVTHQADDIEATSSAISFEARNPMINDLFPEAEVGTIRSTAGLSECSTSQVDEMVLKLPGSVCEVVSVEVHNDSARSSPSTVASNAMLELQTIVPPPQLERTISITDEDGVSIGAEDHILEPCSAKHHRTAADELLIPPPRFVSSISITDEDAVSIEAENRPIELGTAEHHRTAADKSLIPPPRFVSGISITDEDAISIGVENRVLEQCNTEHHTAADKSLKPLRRFVSGISITDEDAISIGAENRVLEQCSAEHESATSMLNSIMNGEVTTESTDV